MWFPGEDSIEHRGPTRLVYITRLAEVMGDERVGQIGPDGELFQGSLERIGRSLATDQVLGDNYELVGVLYDDLPENLERLEAELQFPPWPQEFSVNERNIPGDYMRVSRREHPNRWREMKRDFEVDVSNYLNEVGADMALNDSGLWIMSPEFLEVWSGRAINLHPAITQGPTRLRGLTPTSDAIRRYRETGYNRTGATVHFIDEIIDNGPIIYSQESTPIFPDDTIESLRIRNYDTKQEVLEQGLRQLAMDNTFMQAVRAYPPQTAYKVGVESE